MCVVQHEALSISSCAPVTAPDVLEDGVLAHGWSAGAAAAGVTSLAANIPIAGFKQVSSADDCPSHGQRLRGSCHPPDHSVEELTSSTSSLHSSEVSPRPACL